MLNKEIEDRYQQWLSSPCFDENTKAELALSLIHISGAISF